MDLLDFINHPILKENSRVFAEAKPFPHIILDNFLKAEIAENLEIPKANEQFYKYDNAFEKKLATDKMELMPSNICMVLMLLSSSLFIQWLEKLTGIEGLIPDPHWRGGGIHIIPKGGFLGVHEDFGKHPRLGLYRRLNLLVYLNHAWNTSWGGNLELWDSDMTKCEASIEPLFNRAVLFDTVQANHGHPVPLACPETRRRVSLALYYFTSYPPERDFNTKSTQFKARPWDPKTPETEALRARRNEGRLESNV